MGKGIASGYIPKEISVCKNCFHKDVCGDKDYLAENQCCNFVDEQSVTEIPRCKDCDCYYEYDDWDRHRQESFRAHECRLLKLDFGQDGYCCHWREKREKDEL